MDGKGWMNGGSRCPVREKPYENRRTGQFSLARAGGFSILGTLSELRAV